MNPEVLTGPVSRRTFLSLAAATLVAPRRARAQGSLHSFPRLGLIGCGRRGRQLLESVRGAVTGLSDVDTGRLAEAGRLAGARARAYTDYRELLQRTDVDAVIIASPTHWHGLQALHAIQMGKDVYLEPPACLLRGEAEALIKAADIYGAVVAIGPATGTAPDLIDPGLARVALQTAPNAAIAVDEASAPPEALNWDAWLGPAEVRPYHARLFEGDWRSGLSLGGGMHMEQVCGVFRSLLDAGRIDIDTPPTCTWTGTRQDASLTDAPLDGTATWVFPNIEIEARAGRDPLPSEPSNSGHAVETDASTLQAWAEAIHLRTRDFEALRRALRAGEWAGQAALAWRLGRAVSAGDAAAARLALPARWERWR